MPTISARAYKEGLPKYSKINFWELSARIGTVASILGFGIAVFYYNAKPTEYIYSVFLILCLICLLGYVLFQEYRKLNRFAQSTIFVHYITHIIRDILEKQKNTRSTDFDLKAINSFLLDPISTCFSILTGRSCRVCLKILKSEDSKIVIETLGRDTVSTAIGKERKSPEVKHYLEENTDFNKLWYWEKGCSRYFLCNNLLELYRDNRYKNSSFMLVGEPKISDLVLGIKIVREWKLPYKSTLVVPIRYIPDEAMHSEIEKQIIWGFLCIDCNSRKVFDPIYAPELAAAFADNLYTLFSQLELMKESFASPLTANA